MVECLWVQSPVLQKKKGTVWDLSHATTLHHELWVQGLGFEGRIRVCNVSNTGEPLGKVGTAQAVAQSAEGLSHWRQQ